MRDTPSAPEQGLEQLRDDVLGLERTVAALRQQHARDLIALRHLQRQLADMADDRAAIEASRSWRIAQAIRRWSQYRRRLTAAFRRRPRQAAPAPAAPAAAMIRQAYDEIAAEQPDVSVVVLPGSRTGDIGDALGHIRAGCRYELILPDRAASGGAADAALCNAAAATARADRIAFWNADATPQDGWLAELAGCLAADDTAAMAGAVLLSHDGRLGCGEMTVAADGQLQPEGHGEAAQHPDFASVTQVAALPLGCVMVTADAWRRLGGLDSEIGALEVAFAEFGQRARASGQAVLRQPFARLTGAPWRTTEPWHVAYGRWRLRQVRDRSSAIPVPRALVFDHFVPTPDRDSGSGDSYWFMRILAALGYAVTLLPVNDLDRRDGYVDTLRRHGIRVVASGWAVDTTDYLARDRRPFDLIVAYRGSLAVKPMLDQLLAHSPQAKLVFNTVDLHFLRMAREAVLLRSAERLDAAWAMQRRELAAMLRADCTILLSEAEQRLVAELLPTAATRVIPIIRAIGGRAAGFAPRHGVLFIGSFQHRPNLDAALWLARDIWPLVRARLHVTLSIIGAEPPDEVLALARDADGIAVLGHVPDLDAALAGCRLTVAPLRFGAGIKGKIVSSLAAGVPCVATPVAAEGMAGVDGGHLRVATTAEDFAQAVIDVHDSADLWLRLSDAGLAFARDTFSVAAAQRRIADLLRDLDLPADAASACPR